MKTRTLLLCAVLLVSGTLSAQDFLPPLSVANPPTFLGMNVKSFGVTLSRDEDRLGNLSGDYLVGKLRGEGAASIALLTSGQMEQDYAYSMICENPNLRMDVALQPRFMPNAEWRFAAVLIANRIDAVSYRPRDWSAGNYTYLNVSEYSNEAALESSMLWRVPTRGTFLRIYGGGGTNLGASFGSSVHVDGTMNTNVGDLSNQFGGRGDAEDIYNNAEATYEWFSENHYDVRESFNHRVFAQAGIGFNFFRRLEVGLEGRWGYGYRLVGGSPAQFTNLRSLGFSARWNLMN